MAARAGPMSREAREAILARLEAARRTARLPRAEAPAPAPVPSASREQCLQRFRSELAALGVDCHAEATPGDVRERVRGLVAGRRVLSWDPERLPYGVGAALERPVLGDAPRAEQAAAEVGVTGCHAAIAETGSLVLLSGPGTSRAASLLPPVHVAVVRPEDLCASMGELFATRRELLASAACCTIVTGPSRTADIELTLTLGVHGPGKVVVVLGP
jgi:L-lactate dehydrogenase complex protein LldG